MSSKGGRCGDKTDPVQLSLLIHTQRCAFHQIREGIIGWVNMLPLAGLGSVLENVEGVHRGRDIPQTRTTAGAWMLGTLVTRTTSKYFFALHFICLVGV